MSKKAKKIRNVNNNNTTATNKAVTSPVEERVTVTEEVTETVTEKVTETTEKVETTTTATENVADTAADEAANPQETEEKEAPVEEPAQEEQPIPEQETEAAPETAGEEEFDEDSMFTDVPVDRIETISGEEYKKALRKRFFMEAGVSMKTYTEFINSVSFGLLSEETSKGVALLFMQQVSEEDKTTYNMKAVEAFIKFGLMGRRESAETYLPNDEDREVLEKLSIPMDKLSERQDIILTAQLDNMLRNFFGLVFAKPVFSPDDIKRREEEAAKAKAKAEKAAEKAAKAAEKAAKKESKKKAPEAADEAANPQETEETKSQEKSEPEKKKETIKDKIAAAKEKAAAKKAAKEAAKENKKKVTEEKVTDSTAEPCVE